jgi:hypothetical protein
MCYLMGAWSHPAFSDPVPIWSVFDTENSDLPSNFVLSILAPGPDGALWVGTSAGLARLDAKGHWQTYTEGSTNGGLPSDIVNALVPAPDGALWVGTSGGLGYLTHSPTPTHEIVDVIGGDLKNVTNVTQEVQTVAVVAFDHSQLTQPAMFRYAWRLTERGWLVDQPGPEVVTKSPVYTAQFKHDGTYQPLQPARRIFPDGRRCGMLVVQRRCRRPWPKLLAKACGNAIEPAELTFKTVTPPNQIAINQTAEFQMIPRGEFRTIVDKCLFIQSEFSFPNLRSLVCLQGKVYRERTGASSMTAIELGSAGG